MLIKLSTWSRVEITMTDESIVKISSSSNESKEEFKYLGIILTKQILFGKKLRAD